MSMIARSTGCPERPRAERTLTRRLRTWPCLLLSLALLAAPLPLVRAQTLADRALSADSAPADRVSADRVSADRVSADRVSADAPDWVRERPERVDGEPARVVVSDPLETRAECDENLRGKVERVLQAYAVEHLQRGQLADLRPMEIPAQLVRACVRESYASTRATSLGTMQEVYQLVVLDANVRAQLQDQIRGQQVHRRLTTVGWASAAIAVAVALLHGQLRYRARRVSNPAAPHRPS